MHKGLYNNDPEKVIPISDRKDLTTLANHGVENLKELVDVERGITTAAIVGEFKGKQYVAVGNARLHPADQPNRKVGIPLARTRAIEKFERIISAVETGNAGGK